MAEPLLEVEDLSITYDTAGSEITAVSEVSFQVDRGEYAGLVGESGCGKSTLVKSIIGGLDSNGRISSGRIYYKGEEIQDFSERQLNSKIRWKEISLIPQSSMNSLDPLERISEQAVSIAKTHTDMTKAEAIEKFGDMFERVGLSRRRIRDYPHQFSGGMQQRAIIAMALFLEPSLIIADEPTTALDVIMQDQIFKYLDQIKDNVSMLLITHDISLVFESCDTVGVMHAGQLAESGSVKDLFTSPRHPYTILLQGAFPDVRHPERKLEVIEGHPPQVEGVLDYCTFKDRCPWAVEDCHQAVPELEQVSGHEGSHKAACFEKARILESREQEVKRDAE